MRDFRRGKDKTKIIECCSEEASIPKRSYVTLQMFPVPDLISSESDWQQSHTPQLYLHAVDFDLTN